MTIDPKFTEKTTYPMEQPDNVRETPEYLEGCQDYTSAKDECPYSKGPKRCSWWTGWLDERTKDRLGHVFLNYGLTFP